ncbi:MAG: glycosyl hydrolase, partial [Gemmatimonadaceae bacterium]|nr:glycosyl hydrolase [Chitinophagaceae bacterium]
MPKQLLLTLLLLSVVIAQGQVTPIINDQPGKDREKRREWESKSLLKDVKFRNVGPTIMSGRVSDIDANPEDPTEFYVAYATGGLWHTVNNGISFTPIFDSVENLFMGDIAVDWKTRTIWVGTGEVNSSRSTYAGTGVYKSNDNGKNWTWTGLPESHHIGKILLHPKDPNTAWVAVLGHLYSFNKERGVYKTTDGGKTWSQTLISDDKTGAIDIDIDPINPNVLYAATWYRTRTAWNFEEGGKTSGLYKSTDGGSTWTILN